MPLLYSTHSGVMKPVKKEQTQQPTQPSDGESEGTINSED